MRVALLAPALLLCACSGGPEVTSEPGKAPAVRIAPVAEVEVYLLDCCRQIPLESAPGAPPVPAALAGAGGFAGVLASGDPRGLDGRRLDVYRYAVAPGEPVRFTLASEAFDPMLVAITPTREAVRNDDAAPDTDRARIDADTPGEWTLIVTSSGTTREGAYVLNAAPLPLSAQRQRPLAYEGEVPAPSDRALSGTLGGGDAALGERGPADAYAVEVGADGVLAAEVVSFAFAPEVVAVSPSGRVVRGSGASPWQSAIRVDGAEPGMWRLAVLSATGPASGAYTLTVR